MLAALTTLPHFGISALLYAAYSSGVLATGWKPSAANRSFTSGCAKALAISRYSRSTISLGWPAGTTTPVSASDSWLGTLDSSIVGTSGIVAERLFASTASAPRVPDLIFVATGGSAKNPMGVWLALTDWAAGPAPLNGTVTRSSPNVSLNSSPAKCGVVPVLGWA